MTLSIWIVFIILFSVASISGHLITHILPQIPLAILIGLCFLILLGAFDRWLWRLPFLRMLRLISVPDLDGAWRGRISSSFQEHSQIVPVDIQIEQRWLSTTISLKSTIAASKSIIAGCVMANGVLTLAYIYHARPLTGYEQETNSHTGMCLLKINSSEQLSGYYLYFDESLKEFVRGQLVMERGIYTILPGDELTT
jgi:hypothetical protein